MSIRLDPKYGVNPSITTCFYCGEDKNELLLFGILGSKAREAMNCGPEAPRKVCMDMEPCDKCVALMEQGIVFVGVTDNCTQENPVRSGKYCCIKERAVENMGIEPKLLEHILQKRMAFIPDETWAALGLPIENIPYGVER